jgi:GNAT superfamily N-acetyltransferase
MAPVLIREPVAADADGLGRMHYRSWFEAYQGLLPADFWGEATERRWLERWRGNLANPLTGVLNRIAVRDDAVVGMASAGLARAHSEAGPPKRDLELYSVYVLASEYGTGLGARLVDAVLGPGTPAEVWAFERNARAIAFYEKQGFVADGARHVFGPELGNQPEIRLVR